MTDLMTRNPVVIATEINSIKDQTRKMFLYNSIEIGKRLVEAKQMVPHGEWGGWLEQSVDYSPSTARNLMKIFEEYGSDQFSLFGDNAKSQALGELSYTQAVTLLGVPVAEREAFVKDNNIDEMSTRELQKAVKEKQELEKRLKESELAAEKERLAKAELESQVKSLSEKQESIYKEMDKLEDELETARTTGDKKEVERLKEELSKVNSKLSGSKEKIKQLETSLKEKPIDVPQVVERVPEEIEQELNRLKSEVARNSNKIEVKFAHDFEVLGNSFKSLLQTLGQIEDHEKNEKYKNAIKKLVESMNTKL